ncbi:hypothetical protein ACFLT8_06575 [Chloroflexota bacterium]
MNSQNNWYDSIAKQLNQLKVTLSEKDYKKYKLNLLLCVAEKVAELSPECGQCRIFQQDITTLGRAVTNLVQVVDKDGRKAHLKTINRIIGHLQKQHKIVTKGYYMGIGLLFGSAIGVALGGVMDSVPGMPIGVGVGIAVGAWLDAKARKGGRVICPSEKTTISTEKTRAMIMIGLAILVLGGLVAFMLLRRSS